MQDTDTVDMVINGQGSVEEPYVISANAVLDLGELEDVDTSNATVGYVVARAGGGGFTMQPPSVAPVGEINTGAGLSGDGSPGNPLLVADYANLARLEGSPDSPNLQWLIIGALDDETTYGVRVQRKAQDADAIDDAHAEFRLRDYGDRLGAAIELFNDGSEVIRWVLRADGTVVFSTGVSEWSPPYKELSGQSIVNVNNSTNGEVDVSFPVGYFSTAPRVFLQPQEATGSSSTEQSMIWMVDNKSTGGFRAVARHARELTSTATLQFAWHAIQQIPA